MTGRIVAVLWLLLASVLIGASVGLAARAHATPASDYTVANASRVCATLDQVPTFDGVTGLMAAVMNDSGLDVAGAAEVVVSSVWNLCPRHKTLILAYGNTSKRVV